MRAFAEAELLAIWGAAQGRHPVDRALLLLAAADPAAPDPAALPIGQRNRRLLDLRAALFGDEVPCRFPCPACGDVLELVAQVSALLDGGEAAATSGVIERAGHRIDVRTLDSRDLAAAVAAGTPEGARRVLFERAVTAAWRDAEPVDVAQLPAELADEVAEQVGALDPLARIELLLVCPSCGEACAAPLDPAALLWQELAVQTRRTLREVHQLATAYHWSEAEVLAVPPSRRRAYLEMVGA